MEKIINKLKEAQENFPAVGFEEEFVRGFNKAFQMSIFIVEELTKASQSEPVSKCSICGIQLFDTKIFVDGDFNNSYESRVRNATGKNAGKSVAELIYKKHCDKALGEVINQKDWDDIMKEDTEEGRLTRCTLEAMEEYALQRIDEALTKAESISFNTEDQAGNKFVCVNLEELNQELTNLKK